MAKMRLFVSEFTLTKNVEISLRKTRNVHKSSLRKTQKGRNLWILTEKFLMLN